MGGMGELVVIIGPSAAGKSVAARELHRRNLLSICPTWTTRPPRRDECARTREHVFVADETFDRLAAAGAFLATATLPGLAHRYGLPRPPDVCTPVPAVIARAAQLPTLRASGARVRVLAVTDSCTRVARRLRARGLTAGETRTRLDAHATEAAAAAAVADHVVVNSGSLAELIEALETALAREMVA